MVLDALVFDGPGHYGPHIKGYHNNAVPHGVKSVRDLFDYINNKWMNQGIVTKFRGGGVYQPQTVQKTLYRVEVENSYEII